MNLVASERSFDARVDTAVIGGNLLEKNEIVR